MRLLIIVSAVGIHKASDCFSPFPIGLRKNSPICPDNPDAISRLFIKPGRTMRFWKKKKVDKEGRPSEANKSFQDFLKAARWELEGLMAREPDWFRNLPYQGAMSLEEAGNLEIEKRAIWRRVIYDAKRTRLPGLRWETRGDSLVCPECQKMEERIFSLEEYDGLNQRVMHIGCRCNLVSVRE